MRCHKHLRIQYPLIELVTGLAFAAVLPSSFPLTVPAVVWIGSTLLVVCCAIVILVADTRWQLIPDGAVVGLILAALVRLPYVSQSTQFWMSGVIAALVFYVLWNITRGRGMGFGDVKLAGALGLLLGHPRTIIALYVAFLTGAIYGVILMMGRRAKMKSKIAFGPFMILGALASVLWGAELLSYWNRLFGL
jgi:leader peptidase (prepilin peptidase)/N-methyltransferase